MEGRETLEDNKKSGRPILVRTPEMIEKVRDFVANDRNASLKMMEEECFWCTFTKFCVKFNHCSLFHIKISTKILFNMNCHIFIICQPKWMKLWQMIAKCSTFKMHVWTHRCRHWLLRCVRVREHICRTVYIFFWIFDFFYIIIDAFYF